MCKVLELWAGQAPLPSVVPAQAAERYLVSVTAIPVEFHLEVQLRQVRANLAGPRLLRLEQSG